MVLDKDIIPVKPEKVDELVKLWELSVRATHFFLSESDIVALRPLVKEGIKQLENVYCICDEWDKAVAFMGIEGNKLEMLFVHPQCRARVMWMSMSRIHRLSVFTSIWDFVVFVVRNWTDREILFRYCI